MGKTNIARALDKPQEVVDTERRTAGPVAKDCFGHDILIPGIFYSNNLGIFSEMSSSLPSQRLTGSCVFSSVHSTEGNVSSQRRNFGSLVPLPFLCSGWLLFLSDSP